MQRFNEWLQQRGVVLVEGGRIEKALADRLGSKMAARAATSMFYQAKENVPQPGSPHGFFPFDTHSYPLSNEQWEQIFSAVTNLLHDELGYAAGGPVVSMASGGIQVSSPAEDSY